MSQILRVSSDEPSILSQEEKMQELANIAKKAQNCLDEGHEDLFLIAIDEYHELAKKHGFVV